MPTMSYAALMVYFDDVPDARQRARLAAGLAGRFNAALIGVAGRVYLPSFLADTHRVAAGENDVERREMMQLLAAFERSFRVLAKQTNKVEWRGSVDCVNDLVPREARSADLVVIGRARDPADLFFSLDPGIAILRAGRPVLFVPDGLSALAARRVVVAWKDVREARRAVRDSIPFLQKADEVMIVTVCEEGTEERAQESIDDLACYLRLHRIEVRMKAYLHTTQSIAGELLRFVRDQNADLIVAGGYGRSRLGEWALGGVTRDLLASSPVCCLFSH
jgi:nucleotide-binding universal stress UspA family protein